ncbi:MAG: hypothetical protein HW416_2367, partial [Chloroflexi bacterium]|nr:hypothetical protein [Chloroflexota bacterium]
MSWKLSPLVIEMGLFFLTVACVNPSDQAAVSGGRSPAPDEAPRTKSITIGVASGVRAMAAMGVETTTTGGWRSVNEVHSNALTTSDTAVRKPVPRLAEQVPSLEDG